MGRHILCKNSIKSIFEIVKLSNFLMIELDMHKNIIEYIKKNIWEIYLLDTEVDINIIYDIINTSINEKINDLIIPKIIMKLCKKSMYNLAELIINTYETEFPKKLFYFLITTNNLEGIKYFFNKFNKKLEYISDNDPKPPHELCTISLLLCHAALYGRIEIIDFFKDQTIENRNVQEFINDNNHGIHIMRYAMHTNQIDTVKYIHNTFNINFDDSDIMIIAVRCGCTPELDYYEYTYYEYYETGVYDGKESDDYVPMVQLLIEFGIPINSENILQAARYGNLDIVKLLTEKNGLPIPSNNAIYNAACGANLDIVKYLYENYNAPINKECFELRFETRHDISDYFKDLKMKHDNKEITLNIID